MTNELNFALRMVCSLLLTGIACSTAQAQTFPSKPVQLINPYTVGSMGDVLIRAMAADVAKQFGQSVVVENRPGAAGRLGPDAIKASGPDGHLLSMVTNGNLVTLPLGHPTFKVEPVRDYAPVFVGIVSPFVLVAHSSMPFRDMKGFIAYAKANKGKLNHGMVGTGGAGHLGMEFLNEKEGLDVVSVAYKGEALLFPGLLANDVQLGVVSGAAKPHVDGGRVVPLASTGPQRWGLFPNVPTLTESGYPGLELGFWIGVVAPPNTPRDVVQRLNTAFNASLKDPSVEKLIREYGVIPLNKTPDEFGSMIRAELTQWGPIMRKLGINFE